MSPDEQSQALLTALISLGKIEQKLENMAGMDERLRKVEDTLTKIQAQQRPRTPWYAVVGAVVGIVGGLASLVTIMILAVQLINALEGKL